MNSLLVKEFMEIRESLNDKDYLLYTIAYNIAPTLMKVKPATLINIRKDSKDSYSIWESCREFICNRLDIKYYELRKTSDNIFILFYNDDLLNNVLNKIEIKEFLLNLSYDISGGSESALCSLKKRFIVGCPNEIGVFLGIPLKDVQGYIKYMGRNYRFLSYWKVYNDLEGAKIIFTYYEKSKEAVIRDILGQIKKG